MVRGSNRRLSAPFYVRATQGVRARPVRATGAWARVGTAGGANSNNVLVLVSRCPLAALGGGGGGIGMWPGATGIRDKLERAASSGVALVDWLKRGLTCGVGVAVGGREQPLWVGRSSSRDR
jgi:hypothetical protein